MPCNSRRNSASPEVDGIHDDSGASEVSGDCPDTDLPEVAVDDVPPVAGAVHPAIVHFLRVRVVADVLAIGAPGVAKVPETRPRPSVGEVTAPEHIPGMRASRLLELGMDAKSRQAPLIARLIVQMKGLKLVGVQEDPASAAFRGITAGGSFGGARLQNRDPERDRRRQKNRRHRGE